MNAPAQAMLENDASPQDLPTTLDDLAPQIGAMVRAGLTRGVVSHNRRGELLTLAVKIGRESDGHVITFEDITRQLLDQRQAAWSDVARRIAHEIKNPLTPIQLATERLKRRYRKQIAQDGELFDELTSTIVRQVGDLRKMVDEFSSFARMPAPVFRPENISELCRQAVFLQRNTHREIDYDVTLPEAPLEMHCDGRQISQAVTNLLQNAADAIEGRSDDTPGKIALELRLAGDDCLIAVEDNGIGLPEEDRDSLTEPYVTKREKGTGLGLAIVRKIMEDHKGQLLLEDGTKGGARVSLVFPIVKS